MKVVDLFAGIAKASLAVACLAVPFASADVIRYAADGSGGEYCGVGYGINVNVSTPANGAVVKYAESATGPWLDDLKYVNVCTDKPLYFRITADGYDTVVSSEPVTITPKEISEDLVWLVLPADDYVYDGLAKEPATAFGDGDPSIMTADDYAVAFSDNVDAGTATATFTGRGNYTGERLKLSVPISGAISSRA